ncbi:hypothetical protein [Idiomarina sp. HP20-50]|uniref:hypothetical protein n=1 Tax=Idiomarina sp. HP20-50 TaxID=3070813 RepID=UPI00294B4956|nr:hypothetical protein [Idiomarina sp. HP20-50]MDV6317190.1 hypothetical protein [Idiomarina sp. HP20-50]
MTEKDIAKTINKHSIKAIAAVIIITLIAEVLDIYFFNGYFLSPIWIVLLAIGGCLYVFQKVLVELFVKDASQKSLNAKK